MPLSSSIEQLSSLIRKEPSPAAQPQRTEMAALISITYSPFFSQLFEGDGPYGVDWGADPPDFVLTSGAAHASLEVTQITTPRTGAMSRLPHREGPITSSLRAAKISKKEIAAMKSGIFLDDQNPYHFESAADIATDYFNQAKAVIEQKVARLSSYRENYGRRFLLIYDKLSSVPWPQRQKGLRALLDTVRHIGVFDLVLVTNGNAYPGEHFLKL